jgi:hypothetical protein
MVQTYKGLRMPSRSGNGMCCVQQAVKMPLQASEEGIGAPGLPLTETATG